MAINADIKYWNLLPIIFVAACNLCLADSIVSIPINENNRQITLQPDSVQNISLARSIDLLYQDSFVAARACVDSMIIKDQSFWPAYVFKLGIIYMEMTDNEHYDRVEYFQDLSDSAITGLDGFLENYPDDKWALFFKGVTIGYTALYKGQRGGWAKAILKGLEAGKYFSRTIEADTAFYDAYLGLGSMNYTRSAKMGFITTLPFIPDKRKEGLSQIQLAADSSRYLRVPAALELAWAYIHKKEYEHAIVITDALLNRGIKGRQVLWAKGMAQFKYEDAAGTIETFTLIMNGLERQGNQNYYNIGMCNYYIGQACYWQNDYTKALAHFNALLNQPVDRETAKRLKDTYEDAERYKKKIRKAVADKRRS